MQAIYGARLLMLSVEWLTDNGFSIASFMTGRPIDPPNRLIVGIAYESQKFAI